MGIVCRLGEQSDWHYLTHTGVSVDEIMTKMGL